MFNLSASLSLSRSSCALHSEEGTLQKPARAASCESHSVSAQLVETSDGWRISFRVVHYFQMGTYGPACDGFDMLPVSPNAHKQPVIIYLPHGTPVKLAFYSVCLQWSAQVFDGPRARSAPEGDRCVCCECGEAQFLQMPCDLRCSDPPAGWARLDAL